MSPKNFIHKNEGFSCKNCKRENGKSSTSCRNHCTECLYSLHVDEEVPGDRLSDCQGLMEPVSYSHDGKKGYMLEHICSQCGKKMKNKLSEDDNMEVFVSYIEKRRINSQ